MSFVTRRALSTLIPPKIASSKTGAGTADVARLQRMVNFYERIPKGARPEHKPRGMFQNYKAKHFGREPTATPFYHAVALLVGMGYLQNYYFHLRHHKNNAH